MRQGLAALRRSTNVTINIAARKWYLLEELLRRIAERGSKE